MAQVQRVQRVQRVQKVVVSPLCGDEFYNSAPRNGKPYNRAAPVGNTPLSPPTAVLLLKGSMSLDSQVASLPYESSSFATPEGEVLAALCLEMLMMR